MNSEWWDQSLRAYGIPKGIENQEEIAKDISEIRVEGKIGMNCWIFL